MGIIRSEKSTGNFFIANKHYVEDESLSWKAKGLMSYLFSKPDDWEIYQSQLVKKSSDGKDSVRAIINELLEKGYMQRSERRKVNGVFDGYDYVLFEYPNRVGKSGSGKTGSGLSGSGKPDTTNNNSTNNNLTNNDLNILSSTSTVQTVREIINYLNDKTGKQFKADTKKTKQLIQARIKEGFTLDDFKKVIDIKTAEWKGKEKWDKYLKPDTLFTTKFEGYLNQDSYQETLDPYQAQYSNLF